MMRYTLDDRKRLFAGNVAYFMIWNKSHDPYHPALLVRVDPQQPGDGIEVAKRICDDLNAHDLLLRDMHQRRN